MLKCKSLTSSNDILSSYCTLPGWRARYRLRQRGPEGETVRAAAESEAAAGPGGADHEGAELPEI